MRASADSITPSRSFNTPGTLKDEYADASLGGGERRRYGVQNSQCEGRESNQEECCADNDSDDELPAAHAANATVETVVAAQRTQVGNTQHSGMPTDSSNHITPTRMLATNNVSLATPGKPSIFSSPGEGASSSKGRARGSGEIPSAMHTPSTVMTGYIRARQRTPQTSLGPAKRVPLSERLPLQNSTSQPCDLDTDGALRRRSSTGRCSGSESYSFPNDNHVPQPQYSGSSPKGVGVAGAKGGARGEEDDDVATAVADVLALTEGLRRSAQIALNASSSSG